MVQDELDNRYFNWLYRLVHGDDKYNNLTYHKLSSLLYETEFYYSIQLDDNRAQDGIDLRYRFGHKHGYSRDIIKRFIDNRPCSVFEMMVALAFRGEEQIMGDTDYGDRTGQWYWNMIVSLGLGNMHDRNFNEGYACRTISRFLNRNYEPDGKGGLFTIENCKYDLRDVEIWIQFMWYLDEYLDDILDNY